MGNTRPKKFPHKLFLLSTVVVLLFLALSFYSSSSGLFAAGKDISYVDPVTKELKTSKVNSKFGIEKFGDVEIFKFPSDADSKIHGSLRSPKFILENGYTNFDRVPVIITFKDDQNAHKTETVNGERVVVGYTEEYKEKFSQKRNSIKGKLKGLVKSGDGYQKDLKIVSAVSAIVPVDSLDEIARDPNVKKITLDEIIKPSIDQSAPYINADDVWVNYNSDLNSQLPFPVKGKGIDIAIIDSGIDETHPAFGSCASGTYGGQGCKIKKWKDFIDPADDFFLAEGIIPDYCPDDPCDFDGHGTHVASIAAGNPSNSPFKGIAPDANIWMAKASYNENGSMRASAVLQGMEWATDPNEDGNFDDRADILSLSLGSSLGCSDDVMSIAADLVNNAGVLVVVAAGNDWPATINSPGTSLKSLTVGAMCRIGQGESNEDLQDPIYEDCAKVFFQYSYYDKSLNELILTIPEVESVAGFSSSGPAHWCNADGRLAYFGHGDWVFSGSKPDVVAPGVAICAAESSNVVSDPDGSCGNKYTLKSGTSMATPIVSGIAALLKEADPKRYPAEIKWIIKDTAVSLVTTNECLSDERCHKMHVHPYRQGRGRVDAWNAVSSMRLYPYAPGISTSHEISKANSIEVRWDSRNNTNTTQYYIEACQTQYHLCENSSWIYGSPVSTGNSILRHEMFVPISGQKYFTRIKARNTVTGKETDWTVLGGSTTLPREPKDVGYVEQQSATVTKWNPNGNSLQTLYDVEHSSDGGITWVYSGNITNVSFIDNKPKPDTLNIHRVRARLPDGRTTDYAFAADSVWWPANPPSNVKTDFRSFSGVAYSWDANGNPEWTQYKPHIQQIGSSTSVFDGTWSRLKSVSVSGLSPNTGYRIQAFSKNTQGRVTLPTSLDFHTFIEPPQKITFSSIGTDYLDVVASGLFTNMDSGQSALNLYRVDNNERAEWTKGSSVTKRFSGLRPNTDYCFTGIARNSEGIETPVDIKILDDGFEDGNLNPFTVSSKNSIIWKASQSSPITGTHSARINPDAVASVDSDLVLTIDIPVDSTFSFKHAQFKDTNWNVNYKLFIDGNEIVKFPSTGSGEFSRIISKGVHTFVWKMQVLSANQPYGQYPYFAVDDVKISPFGFSGCGYTRPTDPTITPSVPTSTWTKDLSFTLSSIKDHYHFVFDQNPGTQVIKTSAALESDQHNVGQVATSQSWYFHAVAHNPDHLENPSGTIHKGPFWVDTTSPESGLTRPENGKVYLYNSESGNDYFGDIRVIGPLTFNFDSLDRHSGLKKVEVYIDNVLEETLPPNSSNKYSWTWTIQDQLKYIPGFHRLKIISHDNVGNVHVIEKNIILAASVFDPIMSFSDNFNDGLPSVSWSEFNPAEGKFTESITGKNLQISGTYSNANADLKGSSYILNVQTWADYYATYRAGTSGINTDSNKPVGGFMLRYHDEKNFLAFQPTASGPNIIKYVAGVNIPVTYVLIQSNHWPTDINDYQISARGGLYTIRIPSKASMEFVDTDFPSGKVGLFFLPNAQSKNYNIIWDDVSISGTLPENLVGNVVDTLLNPPSGGGGGGSATPRIPSTNI